MRKWVAFAWIGAICSACSWGRSTPAVPSSDSPPVGTAAPQNSWITGYVWMIPDSIVPMGDGHPCREHPCVARVVVETIDQFGSDYHGQFEAGDTLWCRFTYTLSPSKELFPGLVKPLPGLSENERFRGELRWNTRTGAEIRTYERIRP